MKGHTHDHGHEKMKAVEWEGKPFSMTVKSVPIPKIIKPQDAIIRVTTSGICGTDRKSYHFPTCPFGYQTDSKFSKIVHVFHGRFPAATPMTMGHEIVGFVHSVGPQVQDLKVGDRVIVSGIIFEDLLSGDTDLVGGLGIGTIPGLQQFNGGQSPFVRVPFGDDNCLVVPQGNKHELDYVALSDIFPTSNWALDCAGFQFGDIVVIFGAGKSYLCGKKEPD